jgi:hypothetical protein
MTMEIHLVADTNLFFEFKTLEELPWQELGYDTVVIILTKPVRDEIGSTSTRRRPAAHDLAPSKFLGASARC